MNKLAVVILHYHLRPGGVTRVIERAVESVHESVEILCMSGEAPAPDAELTPINEPFHALEYGSSPTAADAEKLAEDLRFSARSLLGREPDIWHIHNHSLGKNSFLPRLTWHLANAGCRLLLQPHDFAEDGRPGNYKLLADELGSDLENMLYPDGDHIWYAPINYRDKSFLEGIGLSQVTELPNSVTAHANAASSPEVTSVKTIVYPARAIRRKNLGEFLLWSLLAPENYLFQSTLAPQNPVWRTYYEEWVEFAKELDLPVEFDAGRKHDFSQLVQDAEALMTTSIQEGFGLAFLEPWLENKILIGRKLPEITTDFEAEGLDLSMLYEKLPVPLAWAGETDFLDTLKETMQHSYAAYGKECSPSLIEKAGEALIRDGKVDFGILNEKLQRNVIRHLVKHPAEKQQLPAFPTCSSKSIIETNCAVAEQNYSQDAYGKRLVKIYTDLAKTKPSAVNACPASRLLEQFLKPERTNLLGA